MQICFGFKNFFFLRQNLEFRPIFNETSQNTQKRLKWPEIFSKWNRNTLDKNLWVTVASIGHYSKVGLFISWDCAYRPVLTYNNFVKLSLNKHSPTYHKGWVACLNKVGRVVFLRINLWIFHNFFWVMLTSALRAPVKNSF